MSLALEAKRVEHATLQEIGRSSSSRAEVRRLKHPWERQIMIKVCNGRPPPPALSLVLRLCRACIELVGTCRTRVYTAAMYSSIYVTSTPLGGGYESETLTFTQPQEQDVSFPAENGGF